MTTPSGFGTAQDWEPKAVAPVADSSAGLTLVGTPGSPITDASTARPTGAVCVYWICAKGVDPVNATSADLIFNADT